MMFRFTYMLTEKDLYDFNVHHSTKTVFGKRRMIILRVVLTVVILATLTFIVLTMADLADDYSPNIVFLSILTGSLLLLFHLGFGYLLKLGVKSNLKRMKKIGRLAYDKKVTIEFGEESLVETAPDSVSTIKYSMFQRLDAGEAAVYLYVAAALAHIVPNRVFSSPEERGAFLTFIRGKIEANPAV